MRRFAVWLVAVGVLAGVGPVARAADEDEDEPEEDERPPWERDDPDDSAGPTDPEAPTPPETPTDPETPADREAPADPADPGGAADPTDPDVEPVREQRREAPPERPPPGAIAGRIELFWYPDADEYPNAFAALFAPKVAWGIRDAAGRTVPPARLAAALGHDEVRQRALMHQGIGFGVGGGVAALGLGMLVGGAASYAAATRGPGDRDARNRGGSVRQATQALTAGVVLGPVLMVAGTSVALGLYRRTRHVARYYERDDAEDAVWRYNRRALRPPARVDATFGFASAGLVVGW